MKSVNTLPTPSSKGLRALREASGKTQLQVELDASLGTGYLQRLESGKVCQPERETLERILTALNARYTKRAEILASFGYTVDITVPDENEIGWAANLCQPELDRATFPAYLLDCQHRLLAWNSYLPKLLQLDYPAHRMAHYLSMPRVVFDPAYGMASSVLNADVFFPAQIRAIQYERQWLHNQSLYARFIDEMRQYPIFEQYWVKQQLTPATVPARPLAPLVLNLGNNKLQFRLVAESFIQDCRFRIIYYLPADSDTIQQYQNWTN